MAQVKKYSKGNAITKAAEGEPIIFKWDGYGDYNVADIEKTYARNINNYINSLDLDEDDKRKVKDESFRLLQGMKNGLLTTRDASGKWTNVPVGYESTGINEQKRKFLKKQYIKDDDFYRNNAYEVLNRALKDTNIYTPPKKQPSSFTPDYKKYLEDYYFRGLGGFQKGLWDFKNALPNLTARAQEYRQKIADSDLSDEEKKDWLARFDAGIAALQSPTTDDDYAALARMGFDARQWIDPDYVLETSTTPEQPLTEEQQQQEKAVVAQKELQDYINSNRNAGDNYYYKVALPQITLPMADSEGNTFVNPQAATDYLHKQYPIQWASWNGSTDPNTIGSALYNVFTNDRLQHYKNQGFYEDGYYYIEESTDYNEGSIYRYNPTNKTLEKVPLSSFKAGRDLLAADLASKRGELKPWEYKEGGSIIKAQIGVRFKYTPYKDKTEENRLAAEAAKKEAKRVKAEQNRTSVVRIGEDPSKLTPEQIEQRSKPISEGFNFDWSKMDSADRSRVVSAALDAISMVSAFVPVYGTAVSGVTGLGSTIGNAYSDFKEGSWGRALGNAGIGLTLDILGMIPGLGVGAKAGKIAKTLRAVKNLAPIGAALAQYGNANEAFNKVLSGQEMSAEDWRDLAYGLGAIAGISNRAVGGARSKLYKNKYAGNPEKKFLVRSESGKQVELNKTQYDELRHAEGYEKQNKIFSDISGGEKLSGEFQDYKRGLGIKRAWGNLTKPTPQVDKVTINFNPNFTKINPEGVEYKPAKFSNKWLYDKSYNMTGPDLNLKLPDWIKYAGYTKAKTTGASTSSNPKTSTSSNSTTTSNSSTSTSAKKTTNTKKTSNSKKNTTKTSEKSYDFVKVGNSTYFRDSDGKLKSLTKNDDGTYTMGSTEKIFKVRGKRAILVEKEGGILKAEQGNVLKYQNPSGAIKGVTYNTNTNWRENVFNNFQEDLIEGLLSGRYTYQEVNALQKQYSPLWHKYRNNLTSPTYDKAVFDYQTAFNNFGQGMGNNLGIAGAIRVNRYNYLSNNPNSGDNASTGWTAEGRYAGQTNDRTLLGRKGDFTPEQLAAMNKQLAAKGLEIFTDTDDVNYIREIPTLDTSGLDQEIEDVNKNIPSPTDVLKSDLSGAPAGAEKPAPTTPKQLDWGNLLGTGRLIGTIATNNAIARGLKNSLSPLLLDPLQLRRQVVGDLATRNYMERLGAEANRLGARPITSDANLQLAQQLEYNNRANDYRTKGWLADKQAIDKTTAEAQKVADFNAEQRNTVANKNRASMLGIRQAKANIEAQRKSANWQQAIAPWLMNMEMKFAENKKLNDQLNYQENQYTLGSQYNTAAKQAQDNLNVAKANYLAIDGNNEAGWLTSPEYTAAKNTYENDLAKATNAYQTGMLNARRKSLKYNPFLFVYKSGGGLTYKEKALLERTKDFNKSLLEDRKTFHKIIMESQKENNKLITSLSGLTKELIIKSMTYAD